VNLNLMSLGGLALGIGMLVDNSIIVLENVFRHREMGRTPFEAAVIGSKEVAMPVLASTLTTIAVFLPIVYVHGVAGQLFRDQALAVSFSLLGSLAVALTLLPVLLSRIGAKVSLTEPRRRHRSQRRNFFHRVGQWLSGKLAKALDWAQRLGGTVLAPPRRAVSPVFSFFDRMLLRVTELYETAEGWVLDHRWTALGVIVAILLLGGTIAFFLPREFMPRVDQGEFVVEVEAPTGATLEATAERAAKVEDWLLLQPEVEAVLSTIGLIEDPLALFSEEAALNRAKVHVRLKKDRRRSTWQLMAELRDRAATLADARLEVREATSTLQQLLGTAEAPVAIKIFGEDFSVSKRLAQEVKTRLQGVGGLKALQEQWEEGRPEVRIRIDRDRAALFGLSAGEVARFIQNSVKGRVATQFKDFDQKIDVLVRPRPEDRDDIDDLLAAPVHASRHVVPLREVIRYQYVQGPTEIRREDQTRELVLVGATEGRAIGDVLREIQTRLQSISVPSDYRIALGGEREELAQSFRSLAYALLLSVALIYMILAAQFESLLHPFVIILDVPLTVASLALLFLVTGLSLNVITLIGVIVLAGIAVNDSIVKVEFTNRLRRSGVPMREAILEAGRVRLRPILMTSVTTILGLLPLALGWGQGAELQRPLAISLIGGLFVSTAVTLLAVPVVYSLLEEGRR